MTNARKWALVVVVLVTGLLVTAFVGGWALLSVALLTLARLMFDFVPFVLVGLLVAYAKQQNNKKQN